MNFNFSFLFSLIKSSWSAKLGYFEDSFVEHFLVHPERVKKKGPILHKGYYTRFIDNYLFFFCLILAPTLRIGNHFTESIGFLVFGILLTNL